MRAARRHMRRGVTLVEVMVVIAILVVLMGSLGLALSRNLATARVLQTEVTIIQVGDQVVLHEARRGLPESLETVYAGSAVPQDAWRRDLSYAAPADVPKGFEVASDGADGVVSADDIKLSELAGR